MYIFKKRTYGIKLRSQAEVDPEEILLDADVERGVNLNLTDSRLERPIGRTPFFLLLVGVVGMVLLLAGRSYALQVHQHEAFVEQAAGNRSRLIPMAAPRGVVYDRFMRSVAVNEASRDLVVLPSLLPDAQIEREELVRALADVFGQSEFVERIREMESGSFQPVLVASALDIQLQVGVQPLIERWGALRIVDTVTRRYPEEAYLSHVLGYTSLVTRSEVDERDLPPDARIGRSGVELMYDAILRGQHGLWRVDVDSSGNFQGEKVVTEPKTGDAVMLSIDEELQRHLQDALQAQLEALPERFGAAAVALDPRNGEVLALVSLPSFDPNLFERGISQEDFSSLNTDPLRPLFNRVLSGLYPPGSSIKPFIAAGALAEGIVTPQTVVDASAGRITVPNPYLPGRYDVFLDWKPHGLVDLFDAIANSVNVYFYTVGGGYGDIDGLGVERIKRYEGLFGFGSALGIDLPGEAAGVLPDPGWKAERFPQDPVWRLGDTYHISIGQGDVLVTPLQLASAVAALANGGTLYQPHILKAFLNEDHEVIKRVEPVVLRHDFLPEDVIESVRLAMRETTRRGSAASFSTLPVSSAGKTGTAQYGKRLEREHSWFSGFAPFESPEIAIVVVLEGGGGGSTVAVPVAREVLRWYFGERLAEGDSGEQR